MANEQTETPQLRFVATIEFHNRLDALSALNQLQQQHFSIKELQAGNDDSAIIYLVEIALDGDQRSAARVKSYLETLIHACGGQLNPQPTNSGDHPV